MMEMMHWDGGGTYFGFGFMMLLWFAVMVWFLAFTVIVTVKLGNIEKLLRQKPHLSEPEEKGE